MLHPHDQSIGGRKVWGRDTIAEIRDLTPESQFESPSSCPHVIQNQSNNVDITYATVGMTFA